MKDNVKADPIEQFLEELFTNGQGERADRLVLTDERGRDLGGWGRHALRDRLQAFQRVKANTVEDESTVLPPPGLERDGEPPALHNCWMIPEAARGNVRIAYYGADDDPRSMLTIGDARREFSVRIRYCPFCGERQ